MAKTECTGSGKEYTNYTKGSNIECLNIDFMRSLVKQYSELGQWTSALFWADAAAAASGGAGTASGDDIWLMASAMLSRGELHRAAHAVTSRQLHRRHLLCLGVAMRAHLQAREPSTALNLMEECEPTLLQPRSTDQTHNRALAGVLVWQARALAALERRDAAAVALAAALRADAACYEALDLLLDYHALTPAQERQLVESLSIDTQLSAAEGALVRGAYRERLRRYAPAALSSASEPTSSQHDCPIAAEAEAARFRTAEAAGGRARRLAAACDWSAALRELDADPWACADVRVACLVELKRASDLFTLAHTLVDHYPQSWTAWFAVGCYYYLIGKSEMAHRYLSKAKSVEPGAGCVWLAYGHSFAADAEHDQAMAAYFKASQLMPGCYLPPLYVAVECSLLNNVAMCERFLARAAAIHNSAESLSELEPAEQGEGAGGGGGWKWIARSVTEAHVAHEAGAAAFAAGDYHAARDLWLRALDVAAPHSHNSDEVGTRWAPTLDALGHACRKLGNPSEALRWHGRALALRPARAHSHAARGLCLALLGRERDAADALHAALARDPDHVVALALLDAIVDRLDMVLTEEEIPQFQFPVIKLSQPAAAPGVQAATADVTNTSDMTMSFD